MSDEQALVERPDAAAACAHLDRRILEDVDYWYAKAKELADNPGRNAQPRINLVLAMLERIAPQVKLAPTPVKPTEQGVSVQINNLNRGTTSAVDEAKRINGIGPD